MDRVNKYILVNLAGLLCALSGFFTPNQLFSGFGLGLIIGSNLLFR